MRESISSDGDVEVRLREAYEGLSPSHRRLAEYLLQHPEEGALLDSSELADRLKMSQSTVVRLAPVLGYAGFPNFQKALRSRLLSRMSLPHRLEDFAGELQADLTKVLEISMRADLASIERSMGMVDPGVFAAAVRAISDAETVYVLGVRTSAPVAQLLGLGLALVRGGARVLVSAFGELSEQLDALTPRDAFVAISFRRYARQTIRSTEIARQAGSHVVAITDSTLSPLTRLADEVLLVDNSPWLLRSVLPGISMANALVFAAASLHPERARKTLARAERRSGHLQLLERQQDQASDRRLSFLGQPPHEDGDPEASEPRRWTLPEKRRSREKAGVDRGQGSE